MGRGKSEEGNGKRGMRRREWEEGVYKVSRERGQLRRELEEVS